VVADWPYAWELAILEEMPGWTLKDIDEAPIKLLDVVLTIRGARIKGQQDKTRSDEFKALQSEVERLSKGGNNLLPF
jgi:hypothetical protein